MGEHGNMLLQPMKWGHSFSLLFSSGYVFRAWHIYMTYLSYFYGYFTGRKGNRIIPNVNEENIKDEGNTDSAQSTKRHIKAQTTYIILGDENLDLPGSNFINGIYG